MCLTLALAAFLAANVLESLASASVSVVDDAGKTITLPTPATRIITLAPSLTELVYAAGASAKLVGVSAYSDFPAAAQTLPQVADFNGVAIESLLVQKPDLVIAWKSGNREKDLSRIRDLGIPVYAAEVAKMTDVARVLRHIGQLAGTIETAEKAASQFELRTLTLLKANQSKPKISVFFVLGELPLMTLNGDHAISEAITLCGGENVLKSAPSLVFTPSREMLVKLQPQVILYPKPANKTEKKDVSYSSYEGLRAAQQKQIYAINADYILRQGPRFINGVVEICDALDVARVTLKN